jgi:hypothetical protein
MCAYFGRLRWSPTFRTKLQTSQSSRQRIPDKHLSANRPEPAIAPISNVYFFMFEFPCIIRLYYIKDQQDATLAVCLLDCSTCFGRFVRPSSGVLKTVLVVTGACQACSY